MVGCTARRDNSSSDEAARPSQSSSSRMRLSASANAAAATPTAGPRVGFSLNATSAIEQTGSPYELERALRSAVGCYYLCFWLRLVSNSVSIAFACRLKGVSVAGWVVLQAVYPSKNRSAKRTLKQPRIHSAAGNARLWFRFPRILIRFRVRAVPNDRTSQQHFQAL